MKKFFRMALVFVLAGATLLYTGCTKDYSPDLSEIQKQVDNLKGDLQTALSTLEGVKGDINNLKTADTELQKKINDLSDDLDDAIADLEDAIKNGDDAVKGYVEDEIQKIMDEIDDLSDELSGRIDDVEDRVDGLENSVEELQDIIDNLDTASSTLGDLFQTYAKFIQSIAYVPAWSDGWIGAYPVTLTDGNDSDTLLIATFKITPAEAAERVTFDSADIVAVATKDAAAAPDTLKITKIVNREDAPGFVDVYALFDGFKFNNASDDAVIFLAVEQEENTLLESVTSDYAQLFMKERNNEGLWFAFGDAESGEMADDSDLFDTEVRVSPSSPSDSVKVFTPGRWVVKGTFADNVYFTTEELAEIFDVELPLVSPVEGDTVVYAKASSSYYDDNAGDELLDASVWPARPNTIIDILNASDAPKKYQLAAGINNTHRGGPFSADVIATYFAVPDTVKLAMTPAEEISIPWDYKYWDNIADTTVKNIAVEDPAKLTEPDSTPTFNEETETDYTEGTGSVVKNGDAAVDVVIVSSAEYGVVDSTYVYQILKYNKDNATEYEGDFNYVVEARPEDLVGDLAVDLGTVDTCIRFNGKTWFEIDPVGGILDAQEDDYLLDGKYELEDVAEDIAEELRYSYDSLVVYIDGELYKAWDSYGLSAVEADGAKFGFKLDKIGTYEFHLFDHAFGILYEFVLTVNVGNNTAMIAPKATFVTVDNAETKDYSVQVKGDYDKSFHYYLKDQHLKDYLKVINYAEDSDSLVLASELATPEAVDLVKLPLEKNNPTALVRLDEDATTANLKQNHTYQWANYDSLQFKVAATLIPVLESSKELVDYVVDSATVRLWTVDPIPVFNGGDGLVALHEKDQYATADLFGALTVQDLNGYDLVGKVGDKFQLLTPDGITVFDYDQALTIGEPELVSGADYIEELRLEIVDGSVLRLKLNQGTIVTPIVVKVPITLTYMLDQGLEDKNTVYVDVTFKEK